MHLSPRRHDTTVLHALIVKWSRRPHDLLSRAVTLFGFCYGLDAADEPLLAIREANEAGHTLAMSTLYASSAVNKVKGKILVSQEH